MGICYAVSFTFSEAFVMHRNQWNTSRAFLKFLRRSPFGLSSPTWLTEESDTAFSKRHVRNKYDPLVNKVGLVRANHNYAVVPMAVELLCLPVIWFWRELTLGTKQGRIQRVRFGGEAISLIF